LFTENLIKTFGEKERILGEEVGKDYAHDLIFQPFVTLILFIIILTIYYSFGLKVTDTKTLTIIFVYFMPIILLSIVVLQHLITLPYLCYCEWGFRSGEMELHRYDNLFIIEFYNKLSEIAIYSSVMATMTFLISIEVLKMIYHSSESFRVVLDGSLNKLLLVLESNTQLKLSKTFNWEYIKLLLFGLFVLLPSSLTFFAIGSTVRNIKFAQLREIQKRLYIKKDNKDEIQKLLSFRDAILQSGKIISTVDYLMRFGVMIFFTFLTKGFGFL
jgi:hypothetical protein